MILLYNILQFLIVPLLFLISPLFFLTRPDKSRKIINRLGYDLADLIKNKGSKPVIWLHALSVGEVISVIPLVKALRSEQPETFIVFSATTTSGKKLADEKVSPLADAVIYSPLDIFPVVSHFIRLINPELFILVETDFWPNILFSLSSKKIPVLLVNGRISEKSIRSYHRFSFFFKPMFDRFNTLCMQTETDSDNMQRLGIDKNKLKTLGNLKYALDSNINKTKTDLPFEKPAKHLLFTCGSTHPGEEEIIFKAFKIVKTKQTNIHLLIAPRDISRSVELKTLSDSLGFETDFFSSHPAILPQCLIIDTIGDLASLYSISDIAFVGGSLINHGGHNPLEATRQSIPTLFGPHMNNFSEISKELLENNASIQISDSYTLASTLTKLAASNSLRNTFGKNGIQCINLYKDVIKNHLDVIDNYL